MINCQVYTFFVFIHGSNRYRQRGRKKEREGRREKGREKHREEEEERYIIIEELK